jgi:hypothetical protein
MGQYGEVSLGIRVAVNGVTVTVPMNVYSDPNTKTNFAAFLLDGSMPITPTCMAIAQKFEILKRFILGGGASVWNRGQIDSGDARPTFSGYIYLYINGPLSLDDMDKIRDAFATHRAKVTFLSTTSLK